MVVYKVIDALADTYEAEFQRAGGFIWAGKSTPSNDPFRGRRIPGFLGMKDLAAASLWAGGRRRGSWCSTMLVIRSFQCGVEIGEGKEAGAFLQSTVSCCSVRQCWTLYFFSNQIRH